MYYISDLSGGDSDSPLYVLKITLLRSKPAIWRRIVVKKTMRLDRLHTAIQLAMGWTDSHLHQFTVGAGSKFTYYGAHDPDEPESLTQSLDESRYTVAKILPRLKAKCVYEYDFGDDWEHALVLEKILPPDPNFTHPICLGGANACPPEDCGGIGGYRHMLEALADADHPDHEEYAGWLGSDFDPAAFSVEQVCKDLATMAS